MKRRRRGWPDGREQASMAEIYVYDLDEIGLEELSGEPQQETAGDRKAQAPTLEQLEEELRKTRHKSRYRKVLRSTSFSLLVVAAAAVLTAVLFLPVLRIDGTSMTQTLQDGDIVVAVSGTKFRIGDVVAFYYNNSILVTRVIATAGDWVDIDGEGNVYVNGEAVDEPYLTEKALGQCDIELPYQVPDGKCFVMGDHRATSIDSRSTSVGCISEGDVVGRITFRIWPVREMGLIN